MADEDKAKAEKLAAAKKRVCVPIPGLLEPRIEDCVWRDADTMDRRWKR